MTDTTTPESGAALIEGIEQAYGRTVAGSLAAMALRDSLIAGNDIVIPSLGITLKAKDAVMDDKPEPGAREGAAGRPMIDEDIDAMHDEKANEMAAIAVGTPEGATTFTAEDEHLVRDDHSRYGHWCEDCGVHWPCPTVLALDALAEARATAERMARGRADDMMRAAESVERIRLERDAARAAVERGVQTEDELRATVELLNGHRVELMQQVADRTGLALAAAKKLADARASEAAALAAVERQPPIGKRRWNALEMLARATALPPLSSGVATVRQIEEAVEQMSKGDGTGVAQVERQRDAALKGIVVRDEQIAALEASEAAALAALGEMRERVAELERALPDAVKLWVLAEWIDAKYPNDRNPEVQADLRCWARAIADATGLRTAGFDADAAKVGADGVCDEDCAALGGHAAPES